MAPQTNALAIWGNEKTMNMNNMVLTNIQGSPYFKVNCFELKTYHEVIDEIYYKVTHLEPWEKGSRKVAGQTGMCGGVRGVGTGGIVSSAYCLLYKLYTLRLTKKQVIGLINHSDSPYIRGLGFMYIRYTQSPGDLWDWFKSYLDDEEEIDPKAGGGSPMTMGQMVRQMMLKLDWFSTLFPRIPVKIQKEMEEKLRIYDLETREQKRAEEEAVEQARREERQLKEVMQAANNPQMMNSQDLNRDNKRYSNDRDEESSRRKHKKHKRSRSRSRERYHKRHRSRSRSRSRDRRRRRSPDEYDRRRRSPEDYERRHKHHKHRHHRDYEDDSYYR